MAQQPRDSRDATQAIDRTADHEGGALFVLRQALVGWAVCALAVMVAPLSAVAAVGGDSIFHAYFVEQRLATDRTNDVILYLTTRWRDFIDAPPRIGQDKGQFGYVMIRDNEDPSVTTSFRLRPTDTVSKQGDTIREQIRKFAQQPQKRNGAGRTFGGSGIDLKSLDLNQAVKDVERGIANTIRDSVAQARGRGTAAQLLVVVHVIADGIRYTRRGRSDPIDLDQHVLLAACEEEGPLGKVLRDLNVKPDDRILALLVPIAPGRLRHREQAEDFLAYALVGHSGSNAHIRRDRLDCRSRDPIWRVPRPGPVTPAQCEGDSQPYWSDPSSDLQCMAEGPGALSQYSAELRAMVDRAFAGQSPVARPPSGQVGQTQQGQSGNVNNPPNMRDTRAETQTPARQIPPMSGTLAPVQRPDATGGATSLPTSPSQAAVEAAPSPRSPSPVAAPPTLVIPSPAARPDAANPPEPAKSPMAEPSESTAEPTGSPSTAGPQAAAVPGALASQPTRVRPQIAVVHSRLPRQGQVSFRAEIDRPELAPGARGIEIFVLSDATNTRFSVNDPMPARFPSGPAMIRVRFPRGTECAPDGTIVFSLSLTGDVLDDDSIGRYDVRIRHACDGTDRELQIAPIKLR